MEFEWHPEKARRNVVNHDVAFDLAVKVWDDPFHMLVFDRIENGEPRWHAIGMVGPVLVLLVVHAYPDALDEDNVRVISARKTTPQERKLYERKRFHT